jgi:hypothetical protein
MSSGSLASCVWDGGCGGRGEGKEGIGWIGVGDIIRVCVCVWGWDGEGRGLWNWELDG